jgi:hypothetical protein
MPTLGNIKLKHLHWAASNFKHPQRANTDTGLFTSYENDWEIF